MGPTETNASQRAMQSGDGNKKPAEAGLQQ
jgi:hypothetical protein